MKRLLLAFAAVALLAGAALAQTPPYIHGATVGTTPITALPTNPLRRKIWLWNPNSTALIAFCPSGPNRDTGQNVTCAINGAGSITLQPTSGIVIEGALPNGAPLSLANSWVVVASAGGSTYTALEFE